MAEEVPQPFGDPDDDLAKGNVFEKLDEARTGGDLADEQRDAILAKWGVPTTRKRAVSRSPGNPPTSEPRVALPL